MAIQGGWRFCVRCSGLYFGGHVTKGACVSNSKAFLQPHTPGTGKGTAVVEFAEGDTPSDAQDDWRWCKRCEGMFFHGNPTNGVCPAGGEHSGDPKDSGNYRFTFGFSAPTPDVPFPGQWRWCNKCEGLFYEIPGGVGTTSSGLKVQNRCPKGGLHNSQGSGLYSVSAGPKAP